MSRDPELYPFFFFGEYYSRLQVLWSQAGYYVGRECWLDDLEVAVPGTRESGYFRSEEAAAKYLASLDQGDARTP